MDIDADEHPRDSHARLKTEMWVCWQGRPPFLDAALSVERLLPVSGERVQVLTSPQPGLLCCAGYCGLYVPVYIPRYITC